LKGSPDHRRLPVRHIYLASILSLLPAVAGAAPVACAIPSADIRPVATQSSSPPDDSALRFFASGPTNVIDNNNSIQPLSKAEIEHVPILKRIASNGATLFQLPAEHGVRSIFALSGNAFQVFYLTPDGQAAIGGVMWDDTGHDITRDQAAPIPGTIPTVRIGVDAATTNQNVAPAGGSAQSALSVVAHTTFGTIGSASAPRLWIFIDPICTFSIRAMQELWPYVTSGRVQLAVIPLAILDYEDQGRSTPEAEIMVSEPSDKMVDAWREQLLGGTPSSSAASALHANLAAAAVIQLQGTPTFIWRKLDGSLGRSDGIPDDLDAAIASIGGW
jgi:thiol:disulfide interchange protein DsbG